MYPARILTMLFILLPCSVFSAIPDSQHIPDQLLPWKQWVLHGHEEQLNCTPSTTDSSQLHCDWPTELALDINDTGGTFSQTWFIQNEKWVQLPGDLHNWPEEVMVNDTPALVIERQNTPQIKLPKGNHSITGSFRWISIPEQIHVPAHSGIISLVISNRKITFPNLDYQGRLWLQSKNQGQAKIENRLTVQSFRRIDDRIPLKTDTFIQLNISGNPREIILGPVLRTDDFIPVTLNSSLPARLEADGRLRIQGRPGQWSLTLTARHIGPANFLRFIHPDDGFWPAEEIWAFNSRPELRVVEIEGVPAIDPLQTPLPQQWQKLPSYRLLDGDTMTFKQIKRGDPLPAPDQLQMDRNIWLRFDGSGYTLQDRITGNKNTSWRLEMKQPVKLGRVAVDGQEQFITKQHKSGKTGVELRKGILNLVADSEYFETIFSLPATGWDHDFQQVSARLFIPPGWRLINASGMDNIQTTWIKRWTLLDFFIVLILTLAIARLFSKPLAALAFLCLVLIYHEPNAPRWIWLAILVSVALLRHLPDSKFKKYIKYVQAFNILILIIIAIPFSIEQLRTGIYPQLEKPWKSITSGPVAQPAEENQYIEMQPAADMPSAKVATGGLPERIEKKGRIARPETRKSLSSYEYSPSRNVAQYDPTMINQTGPGLPNWQWNTVQMTWNGPVQRDQQVSFILIGPTTNLFLSFVRVLLLASLALGILYPEFKNRKKNYLLNLKQLLTIPLVMACLYIPLPANAGDIPSPQMFEELRNRLLEPDDCFPECADISLMDISITDDKLQLQMQVAVQTDVAIPLPGNSKHWLPQQVTVNDTMAKGLFRSNNHLWILVKQGEHTIRLSGKIPKHNSLQLTLPLKPHRVRSSTQGWTVEGIHENEKPDNQIQFKRIIDTKSLSNQILETGILPPFLLIERTFRLGLTWKIETTVQRTSPLGAAIVFDFPLLPEESVVTEGIRTKNNQVQINMGPRQKVVQWESVIEKTGELLLRHSETDLWTEMWRVDVSPIFHMESKGIPVILHQQGNRWYPTWHPWPGEEVNLYITKLTGVEGQTITIDKVHIENHPGRRASDSKLSLLVRSSQGGQHTIALPVNVQLQEVKIDARTLPIRQEKNKIQLPIKPGKQNITLKWTQSKGIAPFYQSPKIDLGLDSVNSSIDIHLPENRWPLFTGGPLMGPAVLFWSVVLVVILVSYGLSKTGLTPLKFHQWFLVGIGLSQSTIAAAILVATWLIILDLRKRVKPDMDKTRFNLMQTGIAGLTIIAIATLIMAIGQGLLGHPDMSIAGNGSHSSLLKWYQDHSGKITPQAWVISIPMVVYRLMMLAWALWISFSLINLLKWGWKRYTEPVIWHKIPRKKKPRASQGNTMHKNGEKNKEATVNASTQEGKGS